MEINIRSRRLPSQFAKGVASSGNCQLPSEMSVFFLGSGQCDEGILGSLLFRCASAQLSQFHKDLPQEQELQTAPLNITG